MTLHAENTEELRQYLLGDLTGEARQRVEQRLLAEPDFLDELLLGEEELIDDYVRENLPDDDRLKFERHFLSTPERRRQLSFARALGRYVSNAAESAGGESAPQRPHAPTPGPNWAGRLRAFWGGGPRVLRAAAALLAVAVMFGALWLLSRPRTPTPRTFATLTLTAGAGDRAVGVQAAKVKLPPDADALKIFLVLPDGATPAARYRAELESDSGETKSLVADVQDARSVSVLIPSAQLARGRYALRLFVTDAGGAERRTGGSYLFNVE